MHVKNCALVRRRIVSVNAPVAHECDDAPTGTQPANSVLHIRSELLCLFRTEVVNEKIVGTGAIRKEVNLVTNPLRLVVVVVTCRKLFDGSIRERSEPNLPTRSATVKAPIAYSAHR